MWRKMFLTPRPDGCANTIDTSAMSNLIMTKQNNNMNELVYHEHPTKEQLLEYFGPRIMVRKMTEREALRTMGLKEWTIERITALPFDSIEQKREFFRSKQSEMQELESKARALKAEIKQGKWSLNNVGNTPEARMAVNEIINAHRRVKSEINRIKKAGMPKTQVYKQAGNGIVPQCIYHLARTLFIPNQPENKPKSQPTQKSLFD